jgi:hypothetical protein
VVADQAGHETITEALAQPSLARAFLRTAASNRERVALREFGSDHTLTYGEWLERSRAPP